MAQTPKKKQENFKHAMLWFLNSEPLPKNWEDFRSSRPAYFAGKVPTDSGYTLEWVEVGDDDRCVPISVDRIFSHLAAACSFMHPDERISEYKMRDLFFQICATLETPYFEMTRHQILLQEEIRPIAFADDECLCFERIDCDRPRGGRSLQPGQMDYQELMPYWRLLLERMDDYDKDTDQSTFFEMFLMCLAEAFFGKAAPKAVPYIVGPRDAGKTTLMADIGSLFGRAFAADQKVQRITHEYFVAELKGKRFVHCDEAPKGDNMTEDFKALTGGSEMLTGRSPAKRPESFRNTIMVWITSNNEPLWGRDEAARSRYRLIRINSLAAQYRIDSTAERRRMMRAGLGEVLELGLSLLKLHGEIPETPESIINEAIDEENEGIDYEIQRWFTYCKGNLLECGAVKNWAERHRHNVKRVEQCLEKLGPTLLDAAEQANFKVEKRRVRIGGKRSSQVRMWANVKLHEIPINFSERSFLP